MTVDAGATAGHATLAGHPWAGATAPSGNSIWEAFEQARDAEPHLWSREGGVYRSFTWDEWRSGAERAAAGLRALGVEPGTRIATVLTNTFDACTSLIGAWLAGGVVVSLPTMRRGIRPPEYLEQLRSLCHSVASPLLLMDDRYIDLLAYDDFGLPVHGFSTIGADGPTECTPPADDEVAFVQFSSGSTSDPKGCMLSMGAISAQERMLAERLDVDRDSRGVTWLPLSHDMGLFGCLLLSWTAGMRLVVSSGDRFLRTPQTWFEDCAEFGATITASPNFGLALAARKAARVGAARSCPMRTLVLGGERIEWSTLAAASAALAPFGVTMGSLTPAYGLAEATLAVTAKRIGELPRVVTIDKDKAYRGVLERCGASEEGAAHVVSCGPPLRGASVRSSAGDVGRICLRSASLGDGYLDRPEATASRFVGDELITEDLGFVLDGELYVLGRTDDVITVGGRNVHSRDVELAVEHCTGVRPGCSALVETRRDGAPSLALVAELTPGEHELGALADAMAHAAFASGGVRVADCVFLKPGELPKTPSGKVQRYLTSRLIERHDDAVLDWVAL